MYLESCDLSLIFLIKLAKWPKSPVLYRDKSLTICYNSKNYQGSGICGGWSGAWTSYFLSTLIFPSLSSHPCCVFIFIHLPSICHLDTGLFTKWTTTSKRTEIIGFMFYLEFSFTWQDTQHCGIQKAAHHTYSAFVKNLEVVVPKTCWLFSFGFIEGFRLQCIVLQIEMNGLRRSPVFCVTWPDLFVLMPHHSYLTHSSASVVNSHEGEKMWSS